MLAAAGMMPVHATSYIGAADCRFAEVQPSPASAGAVRWAGACKDGYAEGKGSLQWTADGGKYSIEASLVRGEISGEAKLTSREGIYTGMLKNGLPHGQGYFEYANQGGWYEGALANGKPEGPGIYLAPDRSKYTGHWKDGERHGLGEQSFSLGGSYQGQWQNDVFHGRGTIVYAGSARRYEGEFVDGRPAGVPAPEVDTKEYVLKDAPRIGSHLASDRATSPVPPLATWAQLTEPQKNRVRAPYLALERGDDPPYPLHGRRELFQLIQRLTEKHEGIVGTASVLVTIGADGKAKNGSVYAGTNPALGKLMLQTMMVQKYKPASCQGVPCEMGYAVDLDYTLE
jgi:hypothetical protein